MITKQINLLLLISLSLYFTGLYFALFNSPPDSLQGEFVRIMYVHVPSAWMSISIYAIMGAFNFIFLFLRNNTYNIYARSCSNIGLCFTVICLLTGSIWGKQTWNTWWVWDARLTSMLILCFLYLGYIAVWNEENKESQAAALLNIVGLINIPIIKFSVEIWTTLHQPASVSINNGINIDNTMLTPLLIILSSSVLFSIYIFIIQARKNHKRIKQNFAQDHKLQ